MYATNSEHYIYTVFVHCHSITCSLSVSVCCSTRGPDGVKIENADGAVATVTGLKVGTYEFTLTVTDERKLQNSDTVTVIVREG